MAASYIDRPTEDGLAETEGEKKENLARAAEVRYDAFVAYAKNDWDKLESLGGFDERLALVEGLAENSLNNPLSIEFYEIVRPERRPGGLQSRGSDEYVAEHELLLQDFLKTECARDFAQVTLTWSRVISELSQQTLSARDEGDESFLVLQRVVQDLEESMNAARLYWARKTPRLWNKLTDRGNDEHGWKR